MSQIREFKDKSGRTCALAAVGDEYVLSATLQDGFQSEGIPFTVTAHATDNEHKIMIFGLSDEMFTTYRNQLVKQMLQYTPDVLWNSIRDFIEPEQYLNEFAAGVMHMPLNPVAYGDLPSYFGNNLQSSYQQMMEEYRTAFEIEGQLGTPTSPNNSVCKSYLTKYETKAQNGEDCIVLAGMDYKGIEYYSEISVETFINPFGGLFTQKKQGGQGSQRFGYGEPCDAIDWGSANRFFVIAPKAYEEKATSDFIAFVSTFHMESSLRQRFYELKAQRKQMRISQTLQRKQIAQQNMQNLMYNQQKLTHTLAANSAQMSAGIMDSWNKKMASDSRISQARSEATLGVNTYQNTYGQDVQVSVSADHVYQNQYGDVYGVSGNGIDQETLNQINWTELNKK